MDNKLCPECGITTELMISGLCVVCDVSCKTGDAALMNDTLEDMRSEYRAMTSGDLQTAVLAMKKLLENQGGMPLTHESAVDTWYVLRNGELELLCDGKSDMGDTDWHKLNYEGFGVLEEEFGVKFPENFRFEEYAADEDAVLKPFLENANFCVVGFYMGESDSCGPLTRVIRCFDPNGKPRRLVYG